MSSLKYAPAGAVEAPASPREAAVRWAAFALRGMSVALARWSRSRRARSLGRRRSSSSMPRPVRPKARSTSTASSSASSAA